MKRAGIFLSALFLILVLMVLGGYKFFRYLMRPAVNTDKITITLVPIPESERDRPAEIEGIKKRSAEIETHIHQLQDEISAEQARLKVLQSALKNTEAN